MTTLRHRRNKTAQATDLLKALLRDQEAEAAKSKAVWEADETEAASTRKMLELLGMERLPGFDEPVETPGSHVIAVTGQGTYIRTPSEVIYVPSIGEKAHINDVWPLQEGSTIVHSALMYSRQDACEWCREGIPFTSEEHTFHHFGAAAGFAAYMCKGAA